MFLTKFKLPDNRTVIKFDFPGINLLDSSYHGLCDGSVIFAINAIPGIVPGGQILNRSGVYFDYNAVVMTNTVQNTINCPADVPTVQNSLKEVFIYPSPTHDAITIKTDGRSYGQYIITNTLGITVLQGSLSGTTTAVNLSTLPAGVYLVEVIPANAQNAATAKVVQRVVKM
jgi:hypothetical protein